MDFNTNCIFGNINWQSFNDTASQVINGAQKKVEELLEEGAFFNPSLNVNSERLMVIGAVGFTSIAAIKLARYLFPRQSEPKTHLITERNAALFLFEGHMHDPNHLKNLFASCNPNSTTAMGSCTTKEDTSKLRNFLINHLKNSFQKNVDFISKETANWADTFNKLPYYRRFNKQELSSYAARYSYTVKDGQSRPIQENDETGRFVMRLCWNVFIGDNEAPENFQQGKRDTDTETCNYTLSDINLLREAMYAKGFRDNEFIFKTMNNIEPASSIIGELLSTVLFALRASPDLQEAVFQELATTMSEGKTLVEAAQMSPLITKITAESMRVFPNITPPARIKPRNKFVLKNPTPSQKSVVVKPGDSVSIDLKVMAHNPKLVGPEPEKFNIERECLKNLKIVSAAPWIPFSKGYHSCPAAMFVQNFVSLVVATLVSKYTITDDHSMLAINPRQNKVA